MIHGRQVKVARLQFFITNSISVTQILAVVLGKRISHCTTNITALRLLVHSGPTVWLEALGMLWSLVEPHVLVLRELKAAVTVFPPSGLASAPFASMMHILHRSYAFFPPWRSLKAPHWWLRKASSMLGDKHPSIHCWLLNRWWFPTATSTFSCSRGTLTTRGIDTGRVRGLSGKVR